MYYNLLESYRNFTLFNFSSRIFLRRFSMVTLLRVIKVNFDQWNFSLLTIIKHYSIFCLAYFTGQYSLRLPARFLKVVFTRTGCRFLIEQALDPVSFLPGMMIRDYFRYACRKSCYSIQFATAGKFKMDRCALWVKKKNRNISSRRFPTPLICWSSSMTMWTSWA